MKVYFFPPTSPFNPYIDNLVGGLEANGVTIVNKGASNKYTKLLSSFSAMFHHTDIYHFNWIENNSSVDSVKNRIICSAILLWFDLMKLLGGKLAWTMHNKESHFASGDRTFHHQFMKKMIVKMDMILVHAGETKETLIEEYAYPEEKICFVSHGSYIDPSKPRPVIESHEKMVFLVFGMVNRYKNVPLVIRAFKELKLPDAELEIYGKLDEKDNELKEQIAKEISQAEHVIYKNAFIPDEMVDELFERADIVVLPYDKQSMINSGAAVLALSKGKPIIVSLFGAIRDIQSRDFVFAYDYTTEEEHINNLKTTMKVLYEEWVRDKDSLVLKGEHAYEYAEKELSWTTICSGIVEKYKEILK